MRGSLMRLFTPEQHKQILRKHTRNSDAAAAYSAVAQKEISRQLVRYWRQIFIDNDGNLAKTDRALKEMRKYIKPQPDDDIGPDLFLPERAERILVIPDQHMPYHHPDMIPFLVAVRDTFKPDLVVNLGDELDHHAMSFHDSDPNLDSAGIELEKALPTLHALEREFPQMLICHSNHGSMSFRRAKAHGVPVQYLKRYRDVLFPNGGGDGWHWAYAWRIDTDLGPVMFKHQSSASIVSDAAHNQANVVVGHHHGKFSVEYAASSAALYYGMYCGCLIDKDSLAFAYGKHTQYKPIVGCAVILNGVPTLIPMLLDREGRWVGSL